MDIFRTGVFFPHYKGDSNTTEMTTKRQILAQNDQFNDRQVRKVSIALWLFWPWWHPLCFWCIDAAEAGDAMYHPNKAISITSVKINTSLVMMSKIARKEKRSNNLDFIFSSFQTFQAGSVSVSVILDTPLTAASSFTTILIPTIPSKPQFDLFSRIHKYLF